jgi:hypothetical protein
MIQCFLSYYCTLLDNNAIIYWYIFVIILLHINNNLFYLEELDEL